MNMYSIMDSNENENYCYKGAIPKTVKYQNQYNNNLIEQENLMPQPNGTAAPNVVKGATVLSNVVCNNAVNNIQNILPIASDLDVDPKILKDSENVSNCHINGKAEENNIVENAAPNDGNLGEEDDLDDDFSDNNSIGNLSYISENGLIEEIILLPNNLYSDDENGSASDDCIYAYRGGDQALPLLEIRDQQDQQDDETDFLEMDFDPEPSSELENFIETNETYSPRPTSHVTASLVLNDNKTISEDTKCPPVNKPETKKTGTIPKTPSIQQQQQLLQLDLNMKSNKINQKHLTLDLNTGNNMDTNYKYTFPRYKATEYTEDDDNSCLDCTEKEFLMQTKQDLSIQKVCKTCYTRNSMNSGSSMTDYFGGSHPMNSSSSENDLMNMRAEQIVLQALNKINELKATPPSLGLSRSAEVFCAEVAGATEEHRMSLINEEIHENVVTIYTINCDEATIIEALTRIGLSPNIDVLKQYFNEQNSTDTTTMTIPQYLLHISKRGCNYKKLIEAIKLCCNEALDIHYYPLDPFSNSPEIVQISSLEISNRWNSNTNLRQIINFRHKHFHTLNVLGKIVNILRQPSCGRNTNQSINIPQYYKSGYITITRIS